MDLPGTVLLALAGGNALGAYQAGAWEALAELGVEPALIAGASIGSLTGAVIAGNRPDERLPRMQEFWRLAEQLGKADPSTPPSGPASGAEQGLAVMQSLTTGRPGLFQPRVANAWAMMFGRGAASLFDTSPLPGTLTRFIDFDLLNRAAPPLIATAVDTETSEEVQFRSGRDAMGPEHLRASTAFPVLYPPVEIGGRAFVDPGLSANLPLRALLSEPPREPTPTLCIAVDLFPALGKRPDSLGSAVRRAQDLLLARQSRLAIATLQTEYRLLARLGEAPGPVTLLHVVYSADEAESGGKTLDYSQSSVRARWAAGRRDMLAAMEALRAAPPPSPDEPFAVFRHEAGRFTAD